jgi:hypothetical protein
VERAERCPELAPDCQRRSGIFLTTSLPAAARSESRPTIARPAPHPRRQPESTREPRPRAPRSVGGLTHSWRGTSKSAVPVPAIPAGRSAAAEEQAQSANAWRSSETPSRPRRRAGRPRARPPERFRCAGVDTGAARSGGDWTSALRCARGKRQCQSLRLGCVIGQENGGEISRAHKRG